MKRRSFSLALACCMTAVTLMGCGTTAPAATESVKASETASAAASASAAPSASAEATPAAEAQPVTLLWMNNSGEESGQKWQDLMATQFHEKNPNITVEIQRMGFDSYVTALQTKIASGDAPDIFQTEGEQMKTFNKNGYLLDMSNAPFVANFNKNDLALVSIDGKLLAIPTNTSSMLAIYNKDVFQKVGIAKVPETMDEFSADLKKIQDAGIAPIANGYKETWCLMADMQSDYITSILAKDPNSILDLLSRKTTWTGNAAWKDEFTRLAARFAFSSADPFGTDWNGAQDMVATGKAAMVLNGSWGIGGIKLKNASVNLGVFAVPFNNNAADTKLLIQAPTAGTAVYSDTKKKDAALSFIGYFSSVESGSLLAQMTNQLSAVVGAKAPDDPAWQDVDAYVKKGMAFNQGAIDHNFPNEYRTAVETTVSKFLLGKDKNVDALLKSLDAEFDKIAATK